MADAFHRTRSSPDGKPIIGCIANGIKDAGLTPDDIDYVNAHGTSTPENDKMEYLGVSTVFGERMKSVPISSNKSMIGHTLSAAGAIEAVIFAADAATPAHSAHHQLHPRSSDPARRRAQQGARCRDAPRHFEFIRLWRAERVAGDGPGAGGLTPPSRLAQPCSSSDVVMRALQLIGDRKLELVEVPDPAPPADGRSAGPHQGGRAQSSRRLGLSRHGLRQAQAAAGGRRRSLGRNRRRRHRRRRASSPATRS